MKKTLILVMFFCVALLAFAVTGNVDDAVSLNNDLQFRNEPPAFNQTRETDVVWVDNDFNAQTSGWGDTHFATISDAITAVDNYGTINVAEGNYQENLWITKPLTLNGVGAETVINPNTAPTNSLTAVIGVQNVWGVEENVVILSNFKISPTFAFNVDYKGICFSEVAGTISNVQVDGNEVIGYGIQSISANEQYVEIVDCSVGWFGRTGIYVDQPGHIQGNTIYEPHSQYSSWANNGIITYSKFGGIIEDNQILNGVFCEDALWAASAISSHPATGRTFICRNNIIYNSERAISIAYYAGAHDGYGSPIDATIEGNTIYNIDTTPLANYSSIIIDATVPDMTFNLEINDNVIYGDITQAGPYSTSINLSVRRGYDGSHTHNSHNCTFNVNMSGNEFNSNVNGLYLEEDILGSGTADFANTWNIVSDDFNFNEITSGNVISTYSGTVLNFSMQSSSFENVEGFLFLGQATSTGIELYQNDFSGITNLGNETGTTYTVDASYNFWGTDIFPGDKINTTAGYTSPVSFSPWYNTTDMEITSTGQIAPQNIEISRDGTDVVLTWTPYVYGIGEDYKIYSSTGNPYSDDDWDVEVGSQTELTWTDGNVSYSQKYYRIVLTTNDNYASDNVYGYIVYDCITTETTDVNLIGLPLEDGFTTAVELAQMNSSCNAISKWNADTQAWQTCSYFGALDLWIGDFTLEAGSAYMVGVTANENFIIAGHLPVIPQYDLINNPAITDYNYIIVPLNNTSENSNDFIDNGIGNANCRAISDWLPATQEWVTKVYAEVQSTWQWEDVGFTVYPGKPVIVSMESDLTWP